MLGAAQAYAEANQARDHDAVHPRRRDEPGDRRRRRDADARRGAGRDGVRASSCGPARPSMLRLVRVVDVDAVGRADVRHAGAGAGAVRAGRAARGGSACRSAPAARSPRSKVADAQAAYERANTMQPTILGGVNFVLHAAGWLEGGLAMGYEKFVLDVDQCGRWHAFAKGVDLSQNGQALDAILENEPGKHFLGHRAHAGELRDGLLPVADRRQQLLRAVGARRRAGRATCAPTRSGRRCSPSTRRRRSTRRSTRSSASGSTGRRRPSPTRTPDVESTPHLYRLCA